MQAEVITTNGLSAALGLKLAGAPLYCTPAAGLQLQRGIEARAFDGISASKFAGALDHRSRYRVTDDGIAIVSIQGVLVDRGAWLGDLYGLATSYEGLAEQCSRLRSADNVRAVVLDIDSPGGMVAGLFDVAAEIKKLDAVKPVFALAANMAASAAYAIAAVARKAYITRSGVAGSIGVIQIHQSMGRMLDSMGIDTTIICEPAPKANGNPYTALSHGARADIASAITGSYNRFVRHVAGHRKIRESQVRATEGRIFTGSAAVDAGLADGVLSFNELLAHLRSTLPAAVKRPAVETAKSASQPAPQQKPAPQRAEVRPVRTFAASAARGPVLRRRPRKRPS